MNHCTTATNYHEVIVRDRDSRSESRESQIRRIWEALAKNDILTNPVPRKSVKKPRVVKKKPSWCVYILECKNGVLYTGITGDLERRFKQHQSGNGGRFTRTFGASRILYFEKSRGRSQALKREFEIKSWTRPKKLDLINGVLKPKKKRSL